VWGGRKLEAVHQCLSYKVLLIAIVKNEPSYNVLDLEIMVKSFGGVESEGVEVIRRSVGCGSVKLGRGM